MKTQGSEFGESQKSKSLLDRHDAIEIAEVSRKIAVFIDQENVFYASLHNVNCYPDYKVIMEYANSLGHVVKAEAVCDWTRLVNSLKFVVGAGIEPIFSCNALTLSERAEGKKQSFADGKIYIDVIDFLHNHPDVRMVVLVAGSRDYIPLVHYLRGKGVFVIVLCEKTSIAWDLASSANLCVTLQEIHALIPALDKSGNGNGRGSSEESV